MIFVLLIAFFQSTALGFCPDGKPERLANQIGISQKYRPSQNLDQGNLAVCYGFAATYLLEYLYNSYHGSENPINLSPLSVLMESCGRHLNQVERKSVYRTFQRLRHQGQTGVLSFARSEQFSYDDLAPLLKPEASGDWVDLACKREAEPLIDYVNERAILFGLQVSYNGLDQVVKAPDRAAGREGEDSEQFHYALLQTMHRPDVQFPQFEEAAHLFEQATVGNTLRRHFSDSSPSPLAATLSNPDHVLVIAGYRESCCGSVCDPQVEVVNWHGIASEWRSLGDLNRSLTRLTSIHPCGEVAKGYSPCKALHPISLLKALIQGRDPIEVKNHLRKPETLSALKGLPREERWQLVDYAAQFGLFAISEELADEGSLWHHRNSHGQTLVHLGARGGNKGLIDFYKNRGLQLDDLDKMGKSPFAIAVESGNTHFAIALSKHLKSALGPSSFSAALNRLDTLGYTPISRAVLNGDLEMIDALIDLGADISIPVNKNKRLCDLLSGDEFLKNSWRSKEDRDDLIEQIRDTLRTSFLAGKVTGRYAKGNSPCPN